MSANGVGPGTPFLATPASVLVIVTRRMGDVLLAAPLIRSLKAAWPQAEIDALVFAGTEGVLATNPDLRHVRTIAQRPSLLSHARLVCAMMRRYDIALSCLPGDRPTLYAAIAGRRSVGPIQPGNSAQWKRWVLSRTIAFDNLATHTVAMNLKLADLLGIERHHEIAIRWSTEDSARATELLRGTRLNSYAVLHPYPKFRYKMWHVEGWVGLAHWLAGRGITPVLTGGAAPDETVYTASLAARMPAGTLDLAGRMSLAQTACVLAGARLFVGPDTVTTHLAAGLGVPTVALYGPSNPVKWGPWPRRFAGTASPWRRAGSQSVDNVQLVQGAGACVPCMGEGCDRHVASFSDCLQQLPLPMAIAAVERALSGTAA